jgi:hypothetical protein
MASEMQIKANRRNARKSAGPQTVEGNAQVSQNATKHGLFAQENVICCEKMSDFVNFRQKLLAGPGPAGGVEAIPAERIVSSLDKAMGELQKLQRMRTWEQAGVGAVELSLGDEAVTHRGRDALATEAATHLEGERIEFAKQSQFPPIPMDVTSSKDMDYKKPLAPGYEKTNPIPACGRKHSIRNPKLKTKWSLAEHG